MMNKNSSTNREVRGFQQLLRNDAEKGIRLKDAFSVLNPRYDRGA